MATRTIPPHDVAVINADGTMTVDWYLYFKHLTLSGLADVSKTAPTNTQVLVWTSATGLWTPAAN